MWFDFYLIKEFYTRDVDLLDTRLDNDALVQNAHAALALVFASKDKKLSAEDNQMMFKQILRFMVPNFVIFSL